MCGGGDSHCKLSLLREGPKRPGWLFSRTNTKRNRLSKWSQSEPHRLTGPAPSRIRSRGGSWPVGQGFKLVTTPWSWKEFISGLTKGISCWEQFYGACYLWCSRQKRIALRKDLMSSWRVGGKGLLREVGEVQGSCLCSWDRPRQVQQPVPPPVPWCHRSPKWTQVTDAQWPSRASAQLPACGTHSRALSIVLRDCVPLTHSPETSRGQLPRSRQTQASARARNLFQPNHGSENWVCGLFSCGQTTAPGSEEQGGNQCFWGHLIRIRHLSQAC